MQHVTVFLPIMLHFLISEMLKLKICKSLNVDLLFVTLDVESRLSEKFCVWRKKRSPSLSLSTQTVSSEYDCVVTCMTRSSCEAINYSSVDNLCVLGTADEALFTELEASNDSVFYSTLLCD